MGYLTTDEVLKKWERSDPEYCDRKEEIESLKKDIRTARGIVYDSVTRYKKKKLRVRTLKAAEEEPYRDLADYEKREDIHEAYGWDRISEREMNRLFTLWDAREESKAKNGKYEDRVTMMVEYALNAIDEKYRDEIEDFADMEHERVRKAEIYAEQHNREEWEYTHR